jgi:hypothetical protein
VSQRSWVDIACWHDVLPKIVTRVEPDEKFIQALDRELQIFNYFIERVMEKIRAMTDVPVPHGRLALKAALRASLEWPRNGEANFLLFGLSCMRLQPVYATPVSQPLEGTIQLPKNSCDRKQSGAPIAVHEHHGEIVSDTLSRNRPSSPDVTQLTLR